MDLTTPQLVAALRKNGVRTITARKLLRWASPVATVQEADGTKRRIGVLPSPRRRGKGRGQGVEFLWTPQAFLIAVGIEESLRWMRENKRGRWFGEAVLRAFLVGVPIHPAVIRLYLREAFTRREQWATRQLRGAPLEGPKEDRADRAWQWAKASSYRGAWSRLGIPAPVRQALGKHVAGGLVSLRLGSPDDMAQDYNEAAEAILPKVTGLDYEIAKSFFDPEESVADSHAFFSLRCSRKLVETCPDLWLLGAQDIMASRYRFLHNIIVAPQKGMPALSNAERERLTDEVAMMTVLWTLDPEYIIMEALAVIAKREWGSLRPPEASEKKT